MDEIYFHFEDVDPTGFLPEDCLQRWLQEIASRHNSTIISLTYIFCSDEYLLQVNKEYLDHDYYTDIITFPYREGEEIEGDLFISLERVKENAENLNIPYQDELLRVMAHGVLHLIGFDDKSEEKIDAIRQEEEEAIQLYRNLSN